MTLLGCPACRYLNCACGLPELCMPLCSTYQDMHTKHSTACAIQNFVGRPHLVVLLASDQARSTPRRPRSQPRPPWLTTAVNETRPRRPWFCPPRRGRTAAVDGQGRGHGSGGRGQGHGTRRGPHAVATVDGRHRGCEDIGGGPFAGARLRRSTAEVEAAAAELSTGALAVAPWRSQWRLTP